MIGWLFRQISHFRKTAKSGDTPRQLAAGLAIGLLLGLVPKGNLLAVALSMVLLATRANLSTGMLSACLFSFIGGYLDPFTHPLGQFLLQRPQLQAFWTQAFDLPFVAWTRFNNSVVLGSFLSGVVLMYPAYWISLPLFQWMKSRKEQEQTDGDEQTAGVTPNEEATAPDVQNAEAKPDQPVASTVAEESKTASASHDSSFRTLFKLDDLPHSADAPPEPLIVPRRRRSRELQATSELPTEVEARDQGVLSIPPFDFSKLQLAQPLADTDQRAA